MSPRPFRSLVRFLATVGRRLAWMLFVLFDGVLLLLFGLGYVARYLPPEHAWWMELIAVGLPYLGLVLVAATLVVGGLRRWTLLAVHLAVIVLLLVRFAPFGRWVPAAESSAGDLTLMTYNVLESRNPPERMVGALTTLVRAEQPDLVGLQEVYVAYRERAPRVQPGPLLTPLIDSLGYQIIKLTPERTRKTGQPVLGRVQLIEQSQTVLRRHPDDRTYSHVVRMRFRWYGREAVLYNLHLRSFGSPKPWEERKRNLFKIDVWRRYLRAYQDVFLARAWEARQIRAMLEEETLPVIVCGDFNSTPNNWAYRHIASGFQDAFRQAGEGWGATYHARLPLVRIDHVLVSSEWEVVSARVAETDLSDHLPLVVDLRWRE